MNLINEPSSSSTPEWPVLHTMHTSTGAFNYTIGELEGRFLKKIQVIESQLTQLEELPVRQRELETKMSRLLRTTDLPSFRHDSSSKSLLSLQSRIIEMEGSDHNLVTENKNFRLVYLHLQSREHRDK